MKDLSKVVWAEGVFLGQQHFQAWDRNLEASPPRGEGRMPGLGNGSCPDQARPDG